MLLFVCLFVWFLDSWFLFVARGGRTTRCVSWREMRSWTVYLHLKILKMCPFFLTVQSCWDSSPTASATTKTFEHSYCRCVFVRQRLFQWLCSMLSLDSDWFIQPGRPLAGAGPSKFDLTSKRKGFVYITLLSRHFSERGPNICCERKGPDAM